MTIEIKGLYKVDNLEKMVNLFRKAFEAYPKLEVSFKNKETRKMALEASLYFYCAYDMKYGKAYSLDEQINEAILMVESEEMKYSFFRHLRAGSYSREYRQSMAKLTKEEKNIRKALFAELDELELQIDIPEPHIYLDFLGVDPDLQRQGRGRKLMNFICKYGEERNIPLMLFTNTEADVMFYKSMGFEIIGETKSEKFGFTNTYMIRKPC